VTIETVTYRRRPIGTIRLHPSKGWQWRADRGPNSWRRAPCADEARDQVLALHLERGREARKYGVRSVISTPTGGRPR
jgi:hypothetical protein